MRLTRIAPGFLEILTMITVCVDELTGAALDWAVAKCEGLQPMHHFTFDKGHHIVPHPYYEDYDFGFTPLRMEPKAC